MFAFTLAAGFEPAAAAKRADPLENETLAAALPRLVQLVASSEDTTRGGFVSKEGVPDESAIELAWRLARGGDPEWGRRARFTCDWMWALYDSVGGGFLESERQTHLDHGGFDKRADSNARRLENLVDAWRDSHSDADRRAVTRTLDFFERILVDGRGGFVAAQSGDRDLVPAANGLAIHAYLYWAAATGETRCRDFALRSIERMWSTGWDSEMGLVQRDPFGSLVAVPRLGDQAEMGRALVLAAHVVGRESDLARAREVGELMLARFEDPKGGMRAQAAPGKDGSVKKAPRESQGNARAALFLAELGSVTGDPKWRAAAERLANAFVHSVDRPGPECSDWALALRSIERVELPARPEWQVPEPVKTQSRVFRIEPVKKKKAKGLASGDSR